MLLVLPGFAQGRKPGLQKCDSILEVQVEPLQLLGETPNLSGIHDSFRHRSSFTLWFDNTHQPDGLPLPVSPVRVSIIRGLNVWPNAQEKPNRTSSRYQKEI